jgi:hypothetical protein
MEYRKSKGEKYKEMFFPHACLKFHRNFGNVARCHTALSLTVSLWLPTYIYIHIYIYIYEIFVCYKITILLPSNVAQCWMGGKERWEGRYNTEQQLICITKLIMYVRFDSKHQKDICVHYILSFLFQLEVCINDTKQKTWSIYGGKLL